MTIGDRIRQRRKELKLSVDEVAKRLGKNRATVYRYESDEIEDMSINIISDIAKILDVDPGYLMGWKQSQENLTNVSSYYYIPTSISAGQPIDVEGLMGKDIERIVLPDALMGKWAASKDIFFTRVNGDSMNRVIPDGSLIACKRVNLNDLKNGDIVVFSDNSDYGVKRFYGFEDKLIFKPDSYDLEFTDYIVPIQCAHSVTIHGKVILYIVEAD